MSDRRGPARRPWPLINHDSIDVRLGKELVIDSGAVLDSRSASTMFGALWLERGRLTGTGTVGTVLSCPKSCRAPMSGVTFVSNTGNPTCSASTGVLSCAIGAISSGGQVQFVVIYRATTSGAHANAVRIDGREYDPTTLNDSVVWNITIN